MIFKCYSCGSYKFWNKKCYEVIVTSNNGARELFTKKMCQSCGEETDKIYNAGKQIADIEIVEPDE